MKRYRALILLSAAILLAAHGGGARENIHVEEVTMHLMDGSATFELNYSLDAFTRLYVLALGCRSLEPELASILCGYRDVRLIRADLNRAALLVGDAARYNGGYYLFESRPFGYGIPRFTVVYPDGQARTYYNVTSTQDVFCTER
ncbi:MAG: hypothetical protein A4E44_00754 [Methanosaeta sp. PtaB.Bin018]|jgi:hypothetical protein|nr:hypothetical protein [Methanothrix sp.]OPX76330.1 MAG: hypothetical protein A4E44_00754 [Methanosaeta sp. PtaB.Bin018]OPY48186.1 MAG: hypothetical protein A4E46_00058 [Methanosaeta sp. PtaU1.Bin016]